MEMAGGKWNKKSNRTLSEPIMIEILFGGTFIPLRLPPAVELANQINVVDSETELAPAQTLQRGHC